MEKGAKYASSSLCMFVLWSAIPELNWSTLPHLCACASIAESKQSKVSFKGTNWHPTTL